MKRFTAFAATAFFFFSAAPAFAGATVKVINKSDWAIHHMYVSPVGEDEWGPDQLGEESVEPGDTFTLTGVPCDSYDIKVVDEDGDECIIEDADLCNDDSFWKITNKELLGCEGYGE